MTSQRVSRVHRGLIAALVTIYVAAALVGIFWDAVDNKALWAAILLGAAACIVVGAVIRTAPSWISVGLISLGAIGGGIILLPTVVVPHRRSRAGGAHLLAPAQLAGRVTRGRRAMRHTRYGWWLEDAGPVEPRPPLEGTPAQTS